MTKNAIDKAREAIRAAYPLPLPIALLDSLIVTPQGAFYSAAEESFGQLNSSPRERLEVADGP